MLVDADSREKLSPSNVDMTESEYHNTEDEARSQTEIHITLADGSGMWVSYEDDP